MTAPDARQNDELREALGRWLYLNTAPRPRFLGDSGRAWLAGDVLQATDAILPVVTAWAETQARARAAEVIARVKAVPAYTLTSDDGRRLIGTRYALVDDVLDALAAADRTDAR